MNDGLARLRSVDLRKLRRVRRSLIARLRSVELRKLRRGRLVSSPDPEPEPRLPNPESRVPPLSPP